MAREAQMRYEIRSTYGDRRVVHVSEVPARLTGKRIVSFNGLTKFDVTTGREVVRRSLRIGAAYSYRLIEYRIAGGEWISVAPAPARSLPPED